MNTRAKAVRACVAIAAFLTLVALRTRGISAHFWLLEDQIRDWGIALRPFTELPLVGSPTHVGGYTVGPAFYWILWIIRIVVGPWFQNLPHAGGIGQALLQSAADSLLLLAVWRRAQSLPLALATFVLVATSSFDLSLSALVWNPTMGSTLAKTATALVLLNWPGESMARGAVTAGVAWAAVHAYTGAIFVALGVFAALVIDPLVARDRMRAIRSVSVIACVVALLQVPYLLYQIRNDFGPAAMGAVGGSVAAIVSGREPLHAAKGLTEYVAAVNSLQTPPGGFSLAWVLGACAVIVAVRYRRDSALLAVILLPQLLAIAGYTFWLGEFESYYYLSLMPAAVLTIVLGVTVLWPRRAARVVALALLVFAVYLVPARLRVATTLFRMPDYRALVQGSRRLIRYGRPVQAVETEFTLPPTGDPEFVYTVLGGPLDRASAWIGVIHSDGRVTYRNATDSRLQ